jgi:hypothetical protein
MWWSTYEVDPPPSRNLPVKDIRRQLIERHGSWKSPYDSESDGQVFSSIIEFACGSDSDTNFPDKHLLVLPTYTTPELPHWCSSSGKIVLLGDACHAMPPHSGQGVSCAVEDSLAIALLLEHFLSQRPTSPSTGSLDLGGALVNTAKAYEEIRMPRVRSILNWARKVGDQKRKMGKIQEWVRDWIMWIICMISCLAFLRATYADGLVVGKLPESIMHDGLFGYDVEAEVRRYTSQN